MTVESYFDEWSEVYDAELAARGGEDIDFYRERAAEADGPVLELGCGTGRIYLELLADGVDADGIDISAAMLDRLQEKAAGRGLDPSVWRADTADFSVGREYDLVIAPADVFLYNLTIEDQLATLSNVESALAPGGEVVLSYFTPDFDTICEQYGTEMTEELTYEGEPYVVRTTLRLDDEVERIVRAERALCTESGDVVLEADSRFKLLPKREMELLLWQAGFNNEVHGGYHLGELTAESYQMVWVARPD